MLILLNKMSKTIFEIEDDFSITTNSENEKAKSYWDCITGGAILVY